MASLLSPGQWAFISLGFQSVVILSAVYEGIAMIIHGQPDRPPRRKPDTQRLVAGGIWILLNLVGVVFCLQAATKYTREEQQYRAASLCNSADPMDNASSTCRLDTPMAVTNKWSEDISARGIFCAITVC